MHAFNSMNSICKHACRQARNAKRHSKRTMAMMVCLSTKEKEQYDGAGRNNCTHSDQTSWKMTELCLACQSSAKNESMPRKHFTHKRSMPNFWKFGERTWWRHWRVRCHLILVTDLPGCLPVFALLFCTLASQAQKSEPQDTY